MPPLKQEGDLLFPLEHLPGAPQLLRTAACWVSPGTQETVTAMLLRVPCSKSKRMAPTLCAPVQSLTAPSPSPWQCFSMAGSSIFPSGSWTVGGIMPWAGRAGTTRSCFHPWSPWSSTTHSTPCPLWTDTAIAVSSPACSSRLSPDHSVDCTQLPLAPQFALCPSHLAVSLSPLPRLHPSRPSPSLVAVPADLAERLSERFPRSRKNP